MSTVLTHRGLLHAYPKRELGQVWETAAPKLGLSPVATKYILKLIKLTSNQDYEPNSICAVFYRIANFSLKMGMPRRSINRAEKELVELRWLAKTCSKRGRRNGDRSKHGARKIRWAAGINLGPMIDRFQELLDASDVISIEQGALQACRDEINAIRRDIIEAGFEADAVKAYPRGRPSELTCLAKLNAVLAALRDVMQTVLGCVGRPACPTGSAKTVRPNTIIESKSNYCTAPEITEMHPKTVDLSALDLIATDALIDAIETYTGYNDPLSALSMACRDRCADLGISNKRWLLTERKFGLPTAALFIAVIDRNWQRPELDPYHVRDPQKCLSGMAWKHSKRQLNLAGMIAEIKNTATNQSRQNEVSKVTHVATPQHLVREGMLRSFPSTPSKPSAVDSRYIRGGCHG